MRALLALLCSCTSASSAPTGGTSDSAAPALPAAISTTSSSAPRAPAPRLGDPGAPGRVIAAHVVAAVGDRAASDRPVHARAGERVTLHAAIVVEHAGKRAVYSDAPQLSLAGKPTAVQPLARAPQLELRPASIDFGAVVATGHTDRAVRIVNAGDETVEVGDVDVEGEGFETVSDDCSGRRIEGGREPLNDRAGDGFGLLFGPPDPCAQVLDVDHGIPPLAVPFPDTSALRVLRAVAANRRGQRDRPTAARMKAGAAELPPESQAG